MLIPFIGEFVPRSRFVTAAVEQDESDPAILLLNVIEDVDARAAALWEAWNLCQKILVVVARIVVGSWLTVDEARRLPEPDTSWLNRPIPRSKFTDWFCC